MAEAQRTVLVIDDDIGMQSMLDFALQKAGFNVVIAGDGLEGLERLATLKPDAVVSDVMMPNMDGVEVFQQIKERLQDEGIPIIIITALNRKPWFADLEAEGAAFLHKPFDPARLVELIEEMIAPLD